MRGLPGGSKNINGENFDIVPPQEFVDIFCCNTFPFCRERGGFIFQFFVIREGAPQCLLRYEKAFPDKIYFFKVKNRNTRKRCEICSNLTIKTPERRH